MTGSRPRSPGGNEIGRRRWRARRQQPSAAGLAYSVEPSAAANTLKLCSRTSDSPLSDLGSNSFRLVVFMAGEGFWKRTDEIYEPVRIGEGLAATGRLGERPVERALATLDVFAHFCRASGLGVDAVDAVATSAIRDAGNADSFLARAREQTGLPIRVLSREGEARYGYLAAANSTTLSDGYVLDLGGGSMQLVRVAGRLARESDSWRVGTVRMSERFLPRERAGQAQAARAAARPRRRGARADRVAAARQAGQGRAAPGGYRRNRAQPRRRRSARRGAAVKRRAGHGDRARCPR